MQEVIDEETVEETTERSEVVPTATNIIIDQVRPARIGNSGFGVLTGTFNSAQVGAALYTDALTVIAGRFLPTPPPRMTYVLASGTVTYAFIAVGRNI